MADGRKFADDRVQKLQTNVIDRYESIRKQLAHLQGTIDMIESNWTGQGATAFNDKQHQINTEMAQIGRMLEEFLEKIHMTKSDKNALEDEIHAQITKINVDLGGSTSALNSY
ncbi:WXG100 family type VII secretion target [Streptomyces sp. NPDC003374]